METRSYSVGQYYTEPEWGLPYLQGPATEPYLDKQEPSSQNHTILLQQPLELLRKF